MQSRTPLLLLLTLWIAAIYADQKIKQRPSLAQKVIHSVKQHAKIIIGTLITSAAIGSITYAINNHDPARAADSGGHDASAQHPKAHDDFPPGIATGGISDSKRNDGDAESKEYTNQITHADQIAADLKTTRSLISSGRFDKFSCDPRHYYKASKKQWSIDHIDEFSEDSYYNLKCFSENAIVRLNTVHSVVPSNSLPPKKSSESRLSRNQSLVKRKKKERSRIASSRLSQDSLLEQWDRAVKDRDQKEMDRLLSDDHYKLELTKNGHLKNSLISLIACQKINAKTCALFLLQKHKVDASVPPGTPHTQTALSLAFSPSVENYDHDYNNNEELMHQLDEKLVSELIQCGADVNHTAKPYNDTVLHRAHSKTTPKMVKLVLDAKADPWQRGGPFEYRPVENIACNKEIQKILNARMSGNIIQECREALYVKKKANKIKNEMKKHLKKDDIAQIVIAYNDSVAEEKLTQPFIRALNLKKAEEVLPYLKCCPALINMPIKEEGQREAKPLPYVFWISREEGYLEDSAQKIVTILLEHKAAINQCDTQGRNALHYAAV